MCSSDLEEFARIYINGELDIEAEYDEVLTFQENSLSIFTLGARFLGPDPSLINLGLFTAHDRALSADEVDELYTSFAPKFLENYDPTPAPIAGVIPRAVLLTDRFFRRAF